MSSLFSLQEYGHPDIICKLNMLIAIETFLKHNFVWKIPRRISYDADRTRGDNLK